MNEKELHQEGKILLSTFTFEDQDGISIHVYKWIPNGLPKGIIQISHGMLEHARNYDRLARVFCKAGFACYANDHRGHGLTAGDLREETLKGNAGVLGTHGWKGVVSSMHELTEIIQKEYPDKPIFLVAHSWGSFLSQSLIQQSGKDYKGVVLSGSKGAINKFTLKAGKTIAKGQVKKLGLTTPSEKMYDLIFKSYNKLWKNERGATGFEWLTQDKEIVKKYIEDPWCGFIPPAQFFVELFNCFETIWKEKNELKIPKDLPILIISGSLDPVSNKIKTLIPLIDRYKTFGIEDVTLKIFEGTRHEIFNEINRDEIIQYVLDWINDHF
ncbi:MAG: alpha/beta fold hydrolase [Promethearchaeota archaeon]